VTKKLHDSKLLNAAGAMLSVLKMLDEDCIALKGRVARTSLTSARRFGKLAVGVSWAVDEIALFKPAHPKDLLDKANHIEVKLKSKGLGSKDLALAIIGAATSWQNTSCYIRVSFSVDFALVTCHIVLCFECALVYRSVV
jgi:hypothetical protein